MKIKLVILISIILIIIGYCNLPISIKYHSDMKLGNEYISNILSFYDSSGFLPDSYDWNILNNLMPKEMENEWSPEYEKLDNSNFMLIYPVGFDGPYLQYSSKTKLWKYDF